MTRFYSPSTGCSYLSAVHGSAMPADAVAITEEVYLAVIASPDREKVRAHDERGMPYLTDPAPASLDQLVELERQWRDTELADLIWLRERHRDQQEMDAPTNLDADQFAELLVYIQQLRDWPQSTHFPASDQRPVEPDWVATAREG